MKFWGVPYIVILGFPKDKIEEVQCDLMQSKQKDSLNICTSILYETELSNLD